MKARIYIPLDGSNAKVCTLVKIPDLTKKVPTTLNKKESIAKSKNVDMSARSSHEIIDAGGLKVRVLGENSNDFKFKIKNKK